MSASPTRQGLNPDDPSHSGQAASHLERPSAPLEPKSGIDLILGVQPKLWAELLTLAFAREGDVRVLQSVADEDELAEAADRHKGAVILLDYEALGPGCEGVIARMRRIGPSLRVLVLARRSGDETVSSVLRAGAVGLVGKQSGFTTLLAAVRAVAAGEVWAQRQVTARLIQQMAFPQRTMADGSASLTRREWELVDAIRQGGANREIALALGISEKTVKTHLTNIFLKTGVHSRFALARWAQEQIHPKS